jgi:tetratricopeptide (TPR) repeat protein
MEIEFEKLLGAGNKLFDSGRYKEALDEYSKATKISPKNAQAYSNLALSFARLGQIDEAENLFQKAAAINTLNGGVYYNWGISLSLLGQSRKAIKKYKKAIEINPDDDEAYLNMGKELTRIGQFKEALDSYEKAIKINPHYEQTYLFWGSSLDQLGQYDEAITKYKLAILINPNSEVAYMGWGSSLGRLGKYNEAIESFEKAIKINPQNAIVYHSWGVFLGNLGQHKVAIGKYKKAINIRPQYAEAYFNWGSALLRLNYRKRALVKYKKSIYFAFDKISSTYNHNQEFFKFTPITKQTLLNFANKRVFFQNPSQFNDPLDSPLVNLNGDTVHQTLKQFLLEIRVFSLGREPVRNKKPCSNILMWSHYADQHKGLCIGYRFKPELFKKHQLCIADIDYTKIISDDYWQSAVSLIKTGFFQKYQCWQYEDEARIIWLPKEKNDGCIPLSDGIEISSVTFGYKSSPSDIALVRQLFGDKVDYFEAKYDGKEKLGRMKIKA